MEIILGCLRADKPNSQKSQRNHQTSREHDRKDQGSIQRRPSKYWDLLRFETGFCAQTPRQLAVVGRRQEVVSNHLALRMETLHRIDSLDIDGRYSFRTNQLESLSFLTDSDFTQGRHNVRATV